MGSLARVGRTNLEGTNPVIASEARQTRAAHITLDCRASLAMTMLC